VATGAICLLLLALAVYKLGYQPLPSEKLEVVFGAWARSEGMEVDADTVRLMSLNLNFAAGAEDIVMEEGIEAGLRLPEVTARLDEVAALVRKHQVDVLILQAVDFGSRFAAELDQADYLARKLSFGYVSRAHIWRHPHLPFPDPLGGRMTGPVDLGLAVVSRIPLAEARRFSLPGITMDNWWKTTFAPQFCLHQVELAAGRRHLLLFNTVLTSADVLTRERQARQVAHIIGQQSGGLGILAGTLHAQPTKIVPGVERRHDYSYDLVRHRRNFAPLFADPEAIRDPGKYATHRATDGTTRLWDYVLPERDVQVRSWQLLDTASTLSPHRPLLLEVVVP